MRLHILDLCTVLSVSRFGSVVAVGGEILSSRYRALKKKKENDLRVNRALRRALECMVASHDDLVHSIHINRVSCLTPPGCLGVNG